MTLNAFAREQQYNRFSTDDDVSASSGISSLQNAVKSILCLNDVLDGDICKKIYFYIVSFFLWFSSMILSDALILPVLQLQTQQVMTSLIR